VSLVHSITDAGAGRPLRTGRAGAIVRARHGARTAVSGPMSGRRSTVRWAEAAVNAVEGRSPSCRSRALDDGWMNRAGQAA
jgi:hypothetical protein